GWAGGFVLGGRDAAEATVTDETGSLQVTVPHDWERAVGTEEWVPPTGGSERFPALSVGTSTRWSDPGADAEGVFLGLFPGDHLPATLPGHRECASTAAPVTEGGEEPSVTVVHSGCPDGVTVERVSQV